MRRVYIDWLRGLAVVFMIEWHSIDAWTVRDASVRDGDFYSVLMYIGGWAAPLFLFLAGVSVPLAGEAHLRKGRDLRSASWAVQKRGWVVFGLAHVFRLQSFLLNPNASWSSLLKPDILNILGLGMVAAAFFWGRAGEIRRRAVWLLAPVALIVLFTPASRGWWWPTLLYPRFEAYIRPTGMWGVFHIFPSLAYVLVGAFIGSLIALRRAETVEPAFHRRLGLAGLAIVAAGALGSVLPSPFPNSNFWTTSLSLFLIRAGAMTLALSLAWLWMQRSGAAHWSPMVLFGRTSLFVYWVHVEIAYGFISHPIQQELPLPWSIAGFTLLTVFMLGCAYLWSRRRVGLIVPEHLVVADA